MWCILKERETYVNTLSGETLARKNFNDVPEFIFLFYLFAIYLKLTITIYQKLAKKCIYAIKKSLNKRLI